MSDHEESERTRPNILVTGTPGVGKTSTATLIAEKLDMKFINVGDLVKEHKCHHGMDTEFNSLLIDEDKLLDLMEPMLQESANQGVVVDYHGCDLFPERWFDLILVLRTETHILYDRLTERGYNEKKRSENMEAEIMQVVLDEAKESYDKDIVHEVTSNSLEDIESNITRVELWHKQWMENNA
uniref:Adenylate kinase isoenzyme 6 homolog n=1 Tax=Eucampia antarctica TaxID=49252 RepID=A0A7S2R350_9STRA|mmetsp:Transcript_15791/g.15185  ORF Transcript_15791/g.15185 Transcript_15791/m.15185 type:complete len:183 (+) Transcript_15791:90-638(+)|eukprot:CAMPEP_0197835042 /NCGR_PEP_ID=MMETSP1437-20131217/24525_1 /TAXON_ID=49252 ORGANISM="Eucampia antarctica, Strain CCMP1452" /NCGR_SAMPLE_ID=MMETSP1437 /ASSEMBLY_ACC=CAM_ASM_001096 /LENGTH=182 /DNA_ID=CAMNT_0043440179 /DNA_START=87 /DNA_END=635 /DNA_ORIENTATION=+